MEQAMRFEDCVLELPGLAYEKKPWLDILDGPMYGDVRISWQSGYREDGSMFYDHYDDPVKGDIREIKFCNVREDLSGRLDPCISSLLSQLPASLGITYRDVLLTRYVSQAVFVPHTDPGRSASLMLPLEPDDPSPICFHGEDGSVAIRHVYRCPTLVNTKVTHSMVNDDRRRSIVQVCFNDPFVQVANSLRDLA